MMKWRKTEQWRQDRESEECSNGRNDDWERDHTRNPQEWGSWRRGGDEESKDNEILVKTMHKEVERYQDFRLSFKIHRKWRNRSHSLKASSLLKRDVIAPSDKEPLRTSSKNSRIWSYLDCITTAYSYIIIFFICMYTLKMTKNIL